jgi:L-2,4-diaminobutyrate decarboxylase
MLALPAEVGQLGLHNNMLINEAADLCLVAFLDNASNGKAWELFQIFPVGQGKEVSKMSKKNHHSLEEARLNQENADQSTGTSENWRQQMKILQSAFPSPWKEEGKDQVFENTFLTAITLLDKMKHPRLFQDQNAWQGFLGDPVLPDYTSCKDVQLEEHMKPLGEVIEELLSYFHGMPNWNHPQTMANVVPPANTAAIIGSTLCSIYNPNILEGDYSWNIAKTEIESAAMLAQLIGWDPNRSGGVFTFSGTGCYLYGTKLALTTVLGEDSRYSGIREQGQVLVSCGGHYVKKNCADWTGLGMNNVREIQVDEHNSMDINHLKQVMEECKQQGKPVVMVVCTMGTTDSWAVDPIEQVRALIDQYENAKGYPKPFLYADAVIGWSWLAYSTYDFKQNPLQFSRKALKVLEDNYQQIKALHLADAIGIDFHKTGWAPYLCSIFMVKDYDRFTELLGRPSPAYLQDRTSYNPFKYTLETSRTGAYPMAAWATLRLFGREGFQVLLGHIIEVGLFLRHLLARDNNLVCVNPDNYGFVTLFRVYPSHINANEQYENELNDPQYREELAAYNLLQQRVANKLFKMLRDPNLKIPGWENSPFISFTSGFRPPAYAPDEEDHRYWVYALKAFPMSPNANELSMLNVRNYVIKACELVVNELLESEQVEIERVSAADELKPQPITRTTDNWWGEDEYIPIKYLIPSPSLTIKEMLKKTPVCAHLSDSQLDELVGAGKTESIEAGQVLFAEGDKADQVYLILAGKAKVYKLDGDGNEIELATLGIGDFFGEMALFDRGLRSAAIKSLEACQFCVIAGDKFLDIVLD